MKALLIADDEKAAANICEVLKGAGYDVIVYKWLLKAMDNLEEIKPEMIVVSAKDYPRQWKTLAQYSTNLESDEKPQIILFSPEPLSDEELRKAEALQVRGIFRSADSDGLNELKEIIKHKQKISLHENQIQKDEKEKDDDEGIITLKDLLPELGDLKSISHDIDSLKEELNKPFDINEAIRQLQEAQKEQKEKDDENQKNLEAEKESDIIEEDKNQKSEDDEISENKSENDSEPKDEKMNEEDIEAKLAAIMNANKADAKEKAEEAGIDNYSCSFVFTNPITLALVTGTARNYNGMTLEFMPDIPNFIMNLAPDTQISDASLKVNGEISDVKAEVMSNDAKKLYLQIKK